MPNLIEIVRDFFLKRLKKQSKKEPFPLRKKTPKKIKHTRVRRRIKSKLKKIVQPKLKVKAVKQPEIQKVETPLKVQRKLEQIKPISKPFLTFPKIRINVFKQVKLPKIKLPKLTLSKPQKPKPFKLPTLFKVPKVGKRRSAKKLPKTPKEHVVEAIVADVMERHVYSVQPSDTLSYVVRLFADKKISGAPVMKNNRLVGIIGESDIVRFIGGKELLAGGSSGLKNLGEIKVEGVMHKNPVSVFEYTKLSEVADLMNEYDITRLPVLDERRELIGIVSRSDIMRGISKNLLLKLLEKHEVQKVMNVETDIDEILKIVERKGSIGIGEIQKRLMLPEEKIEEWGKILERHNLIELFYPPIGKPEFRKKIK